MQKTNRNYFVIFTFIFIAFIALVFCVSSFNVAPVAYAATWDGTTASAFSGGDGSEGTPYQISSGDTLAYLASQNNSGLVVAGSYFVLTDDIYLNDLSNFNNWDTAPPANNWTAIGTPTHPFNGNFDGNGKTIFGLYTDADNYGGLFGFTDGAIISVTYFEGAYINSNSDSGILAGYAFNTTISDSSVSASKVVGRNIDLPDPPEEPTVILSGNFGGILGTADSSIISNCVSNVTISGSKVCGGIVGEAIASTVTECYFVGQVTVKDNTAGGIAGINSNILNNCFSEGTVTGTNKIGGIVGNNDSVASNISQCLSLTTIDTLEDATYIGALAGANYGSITFSYYNKDVIHFYPTGASTDFGESGLQLIDIVGSSLQTELGAKWTYTEQDGDTYFYPQLTAFFNINYYNLVAYEISLYNGITLHKLLCEANKTYTLPIMEQTGLVLTWQTEDGTESWGETVTEITSTSTASYYLKTTVIVPTISLESEDIDIVFDNNTHNISVTAESELGAQYLIYEWYYCDTEFGEYTLLSESECVYQTKDNTDSGYYYCLVWVENGDLVSEKVQSRTFEVSIAKADINSASVPSLEVLNGTYDPDKTLADYTLNLNFYWADSSIVPTCDRNYLTGIDEGYSVYYNTDLVNFNNYFLTGYISLGKATYIDITHNNLSGVYLETRKLSDFSLADNFVWADGTTKPIVNTTSYPAIYNADAVNYNDYELDITLNLTKATYENITHTELSGTYNPFKELADYPLFNAYYHWVDDTIVPTHLINKYSAIYNTDSDNYFDYQLDITLHINKANPTVTASFVTPAKIFVGDSLPPITIGSSNTPGTISWDSYNLEAGENICSWTFVPTDSDNYYNLNSDVSFTVLEVAVGSIQISQPPTKTTYFALEQADVSGMEVTAIFNNELTKVITAYQISYQNGDYFIYGDTYFVVNYVVGDSTFTANQSVSIKRISIDIPSIGTYYYNGQLQTHDIEASDYYSVSGNTQSLAGTYYLTATLNDQTNYCWEDNTTVDKSIEWVINPQEVIKPTVIGEYTYNGLMQEVQLVEDERYSITNRQQKVVGTYVVIVSLNDKENYIWIGGGTNDLSLNWEITKYYVNKPVYTESNFVYNGEIQTAVITKSIVYAIVNDAQKNAGNYVAEVTLKDTINYCWADETTSKITFPYVISKQEVPEPTLINGSFIYNGNVQRAQISNNAAYIISGDSHVNAGTYENVVVAIDGNNYIWEDNYVGNYVFTMTIAKLQIAKPTITGSYTYNGQEQDVVIATNDYYALSSLAFVNAGDYAVDVVLFDTNNTEWTDSSTGALQIQYTVAKKPQARLTLASTTFTYTGSVITYNLPIDMDVFSVTNHQSTNVGSYTAQIALKNPNNYVWVGIQDDCTAPYQIIPQKVTKPQCNQTNFYIGTEQSAAIAESTKYILSGNKGTNAGNYTATVSLRDTNNYTWADGSTASFTIAWQIAKVKINKPQQGIDLFYNGLTQKYVLAESPSYTITGNTGTEGGEYIATVALVSKVNTEWTDGTTTDLLFSWNIYYIKGNTGDGEKNITAFSDNSIQETPQKDGYLFLGWYASADFSGEKVTSVDSLSGDTTLYAKWVAVESIAPDDKGKGGISTKGIVGLSVGGVLVLLAFALIAYSFIKKKGIK